MRRKILNGLQYIKGQKVCRVSFDEIDSTNTYAKGFEITENDVSFVFTAERQTMGRGRLGRGFLSELGGLYFSILCKDLPCKIDVLTPYVAVCVSKAIDKVCNTKTQIKWVNDVYLDGLKVCGILCESLYKDSRIDKTVIGVGINVKSVKFGKDLENIAGALEDILKTNIDKEELLCEILEEFFAHDSDFMNIYKEKSLVIGKKVCVLADAPYTAYAVDITDTGALVVELEDASRRTLYFGDVSVRLK